MQNSGHYTLRELASDSEHVLRSIFQAHENVLAIAVETAYVWPEINGLKDRIETRRRACLSGMPVEVLEEIGSRVCRQRNLSHLSRTCRKFHVVLTPILYRRESRKGLAHIGDYAWYWAVKSGRHQTIRRAVAAGSNSGGLSHLLRAAEAGNCAMIEALLAARRVRDEWYICFAEEDEGKDPVRIAIVHGHTEAAKILVLHAMADNDERICSMAWLRTAVRQGNLALIRFLIRSGASVITDYSDGTALLECAVETGQTEACQLLLTHGALPRCDASSMEELDKYSSLLLDAARLGHSSIMKLLVDAGCNVHAVGSYGGTSLHYAARSGATEVIDFLLLHGINIDVADEDGHTALHAAIWDMNLDVVKALATRGANIEAVDNSQRSPLQRSVERGAFQITALLISLGANIHHLDASGDSVIHGVQDIDTLQLLLQHGADLNLRNAAGGTPFLRASGRANVDMLKLMLDHGADMNVTDNDGATPILNSSANGFGDVVKFLIDQGADVNPAPTISAGLRPLWLAADHKHSETAIILIKAGADVNARDDDGWSPLHAAVQECSDEVIKLLLERGADANARSNPEGMTPLVFASEWSSYPPAERVRMLLTHDADPTVQVGGRLAIHGTWGCRVDQTEAIKELVRHGTDPNTRTTEGKTALMIAAVDERDSLVAWLAENGADVTLADAGGRTALHYAKSAAVAETLLKHGAGVGFKDYDGMAPLLYAAWSARADMVQCLLEHGADIESTCDSGMTALHYAVLSQCSYTISFLLTRRAPVDALDNDLDTPLFMACTSGDVGVTKVLLEHGADPHTNCGGTSPFNAAICEGHAGVLRVLLDNGGRVNEITANGERPLLHAAEHGHKAVVKLLLTHGSDMDALDENGRTAADVALAYGHENVASLIRRYYSRL